MNINLGFPWFTMSEAAIDEMVTGMFFVMFHNFFGIVVPADSEVVKLLESVLSIIKETVKADHQQMPEKMIKSWIDAFRGTAPNITGQDKAEMADLAKDIQKDRDWFKTALDKYPELRRPMTPAHPANGIYAGPTVKPFSNEDRLDFDGNTAYPKGFIIGDIPASHLRSMPHMDVMPSERLSNGVYAGPNLHAPQPVQPSWAYVKDQLKMQQNQPRSALTAVLRHFVDRQAKGHCYMGLFETPPHPSAPSPIYLFTLAIGEKIMVIYDPCADNQILEGVLCTPAYGAGDAHRGLIIGPNTAALDKHAKTVNGPFGSKPVYLNEGAVQMLINLAKYIKNAAAIVPFWEQFNPNGVSAEYVNMIMSEILRGAPKMDEVIKDELPNPKMPAEQVAKTWPSMNVCSNMAPCNKVKALRLKLMMTREQFADTIGVATKTLAKWELDIAHPQPPAKILLDLIDAYGQDILDKIAKLNPKN